MPLTHRLTTFHLTEDTDFFSGTFYLNCIWQKSQRFSRTFFKIKVSHQIFFLFFF